LAIYYLVFRSLIAYLTKAGLESTKMMLLIPPEASRGNYNLQVLLRGKEGADLFFQENGLEIPKDGKEATGKEVKETKKEAVATGKKDAIKITVDDEDEDDSPKAKQGVIKRSLNSLNKLVNGDGDDGTDDLKKELQKSLQDISIRKSAEVLVRASQNNLAEIASGKGKKEGSSSPKVSKSAQITEGKVSISNTPNVHAIPSRDDMKKSEASDLDV